MSFSAFFYFLISLCFCNNKDLASYSGTDKNSYLCKGS